MAAETSYWFVLIALSWYKIDPFFICTNVTPLSYSHQCHFELVSFCTSSVSHSCHTPWVTWRDSFHSKYGQKIRILVFMGHSVKICTTLQKKLMTLAWILFRTVSIPFISPFYILLFINIVHNISIPVNYTYCRDQINESTETDVLSLAPRKNPLTWCMNKL